MFSLQSGGPQEDRLPDDEGRSRECACPSDYEDYGWARGKCHAVTDAEDLDYRKECCRYVSMAIFIPR